MKGVLVLRKIKKDWKAITGISYVGVSGDAYELKTLGFRWFRFMYIRSRFCQSPKSWPNVQDADDTVPSNEYALVLGYILAVSEYNT